MQAHASPVIQHKKTLVQCHARRAPRPQEYYFKPRSPSPRSQVPASVDEEYINILNFLPAAKREGAVAQSWATTTLEGRPKHLVEQEHLNYNQSTTKNTAFVRRGRLRVARE